MTQDTTPYEALEQAVAIAGGQSATARLCNVSQAAVWKWLQSGKRLPAEHVLTMSTATGVSPFRLRPDIYPLSLIVEDRGHTEECGPVVLPRFSSVACDHTAKTQRSDAA